MFPSARELYFGDEPFTWKDLETGTECVVELTDSTLPCFFFPEVLFDFRGCFTATTTVFFVRRVDIVGPSTCLSDDAGGTVHPYCSHAPCSLLALLFSTDSSVLGKCFAASVRTTLRIDCLDHVFPSRYGAYTFSQV